MDKKFERVNISYEDFKKVRQSGWLELQEIIGVFSEASRETMGNEDKTKNWIMFKDGSYLYKGIECDSEKSAGYAYAELIIEELAKQVGLEAAFYDLARYGDELGIITKNIIENDNQEMVSLCSILEEDKDSEDTEELLNNMIEALEHQEIHKEDIEKMKTEYIKRRIFDLFIMATDNHTENISLILEIDEKQNRRARFSPVYDNESSLLLDYTEHQMSLMLRDGLHIQATNYIDTKIEPTLQYGENWKEQLIFLSEMPGGKEFIEKCKANLNIEKAIINVEEKTEEPLPETIKKFVGFVFNERKTSIEKELQRSEKGENYCAQIAEMSQNFGNQEFKKLLYSVFNGIKPEHEDRIKKLESIDII